MDRENKGLDDMASALDIVNTWHTALNTGDVDQLVALVDDEVEVGGARGSMRGAQVVREWFGRANVRLYPLRSFQHENRVVVEERGEWQSPDTGEVTGTQTVATHFIVDNRNHITRIMRYDDLVTALQEAGLSEIDEIR
jgi:ketosteroid isomerase-like protein